MQQQPFNNNRLVLLALLLSTVYLQESAARSKQVNLRMCTRNRTLSVEVLASEDDASCHCLVASTSALSNAGDGTREDYVRTPGIGSHKLHTEALSWNDARRACMEEGAHLAVINSKAEETVLIDLLKESSNSIKQAVNKEQALLGIHDFFHEGEWLTILGEPLTETGYAEWTTKWYGPQPDNYQGQNCGALVIHGGMDDVFCHEKLAFFCEMPIPCV